MKTILRSGSEPSSSLRSASACRAQRPVLSTQQILEQLERDWVAAMQRNDVDFVDSVLAPEFVSTYDDGTRGDRVRELQLVKEFNRQVDKWTVDEFTVKVFGDTAVVWFTQRMVGPVRDKPTEIVMRYMDVFVNRDGKWLCVGSQSTKVTASNDCERSDDSSTKSIYLGLSWFDRSCMCARLRSSQRGDSSSSRSVSFSVRGFGLQGSVSTAGSCTVA